MKHKKNRKLRIVLAPCGDKSTDIQWLAEGKDGILFSGSSLTFNSQVPRTLKHVIKFFNDYKRRYQ